MDRKRKLYLICGAALILLVFIATALIMSAQKRNTPIPEPEPDPVETIAPATPDNTPEAIATPTTPVLPETSMPPAATPTEAPELPEAGIAETPEPTATPKPTAKPSSTAKPTAVPNVELPSGTSNTTTPAAATPKPADSGAVTVAGFDFALPTRANEKTSVTISANSTNAQSVVWTVTKKGFLGIPSDAANSVTGTLGKTGGTLAFADSGTYTVTATVKTADGKTETISREIEVKAADNFNFSMPLTAYADTVVHVQVQNGAEAAAWEVLKESSAIQQSDAFSGALTKTGGFITFKSEGKYTLTGSNRTGKEVSATITVYALPTVGFSVDATTYRNKEITVAMSEGAQQNGIAWEVKQGGETVAYKGTLGNTGGKISLEKLGVFTITASVKDSRTGRTFATTRTVSVLNQPPSAPQGTVMVTDTQEDGKVLISFSAASNDPDGDALTYEWDGRTVDDYYAIGGTYTVMVRAKDSLGAYSQWTEVSFNTTE